MFCAVCPHDAHHSPCAIDDCGCLARPPKGTTKSRHRQRTRDANRDERLHKAMVRTRDVRCRFPLCGCRRSGHRLEASHDKHKGIGGNPAGDRSETAVMVLMCLHRHQDGIFSRHRGTVQNRYLTEAGNDGPIAWMLDAITLERYFWRTNHPTLAQKCLEAIRDADGWVEIAREDAQRQLIPPEPWQRAVLERLAAMDI